MSGAASTATAAPRLSGEQDLIAAGGGRGQVRNFAPAGESVDVLKAVVHLPQSPHRRLTKLGPAKPDFWVKLDVLGRVIR